MIIADEKKSCEDDKCSKCFRKLYLGGRESKGTLCNACFINREEREGMLSGIDWASGKYQTVGNLRVNTDIPETIKGLKAVQREAKKTTAALKELGRVAKLTDTSEEGLKYMSKEDGAT